jgi:3-oxoacyl-[acyl-carrier-protein] synthase II
VSAGANGSVEGDRAEAQALLDVLGEAAARTPLIAVKASLGETIDAAGLLQAAVALSAMSSGRAPPIARLEEPEVPGLRYATRPLDVAAGHALVTATSQTGACSALVLSMS